uniref:VQ domain-containing protein n=1 Tax=Triticum urartu TaxID=4572 RepID=A0A8R7UZ34_TRIUA
MDMRAIDGDRGGPSRRPPTSAGRTAPKHGVKVTHIVPREVIADETSFKDVVQRLTGKDSAAARLELLGDCNPVRMTAAPAVADAGVSIRSCNDGTEAAGGSSPKSNGSVEGGDGGAAGVFPAVSLFEDMVAADVLPSLDEMNCWWGTRD